MDDLYNDVRAIKSAGSKAELLRNEIITDGVTVVQRIRGTAPAVNIAVIAKHFYLIKRALASARYQP